MPSIRPHLLTWFGWLACSLLISVAPDLPGQMTNLPADPMERSRQIDAQLQKLDQTPVGQKIAEMEKKFRSARAQVSDARQEFEAEYARLRDTKEYRDYEKQRQELAEKRDTQWTREWKAMADAAAKLYAARHVELKKLAANDLPHARQLGLDVLTYPRVDGSTSTHPLSVIIASRVLGTPYEWIYPEPTGSPYRPRLNLPMDLYLYDEYEDYPPEPNLEFTLAASRVVAKPSRPGQERLPIMINSLLAISTSTHNAYTNLLAGKCDLNLTARGPSADEIELAKAKGIKIELRPIARDALVFIVNRNNPVKTISRQQILQIYQGKIRNWAELGSGTNEIAALWREPNSGSRELFDKLVAAGQSVPEPKYRSDLFSYTMAGPYNQVTQSPSGLGYSVYYYEHYMALSAFTRTVAIDGIEPTADTIASGAYPYSADVYAAYRAGEPPDSPAMKLLNWLVSPEGQAVIRESGYVPVK